MDSWINMLLSVSWYFTGIKSAVMLYIVIRTLDFLPWWLHTTPHTHTNKRMPKWKVKGYSFYVKPAIYKRLGCRWHMSCILYNPLNLILHEKGGSTHNKNKARLVCIDKHFGCWRPGDTRSHDTTRHTLKNKCQMDHIINSYWFALYLHLKLNILKYVF